MMLKHTTQAFLRMLSLVLDPLNRPRRLLILSVMHSGQSYAATTCLPLHDPSLAPMQLVFVP